MVAESRRRQPAPPPGEIVDPGSVQSIQALVDAAVPGGQVHVPAGVYRETVTITKPLTLIGDPGAVIDGRDRRGSVVRDRWVVGAADNVTIRGFEMRYANNPNQTGGISNDGYDNWTMENLNLHHANGANVSLMEGRNVTLRNSAIHDGGQLGIHGWNTEDAVIEGNTIYGNNTNGVDPAWEAGGMKLAEARNVRVAGNEVYDNVGPGLWCDIDCADVTIEANQVHHNDWAGIHYEISASGVIRNNQVWNNGFERSDWGWGAGILIQNSRDTLVDGNVVAWNADGITVIGQERGTDRWNDVTGNTITGNTISLANPNWQNNTFLLAFVRDGGHTGPGYAASWEHSGNEFYHADPDGPWPFGFDGSGWFPYSGVAEFEPTGGVMSMSNLSSRLSSAGVPSSP